MTFEDFGRFLRRWWWLLVLLPVVGAAAGIVMTRDQPYSSIVRATVLLPGDTEDTGSAERPELMILDDAPALISSTAFAEMVHGVLPADLQQTLSVDDVKSSLSGSRYSRVLTIVATDATADHALAIATASAQVLPDAVNQYLVADGSKPATVKIIDPPSAPEKDRMGRMTRIGAQVFAAFALAVVVAVLLDGVFGRERPGNSAPG
jgi:uncharacterized protein involved in exopolysaccharide biosynthesis